MMEAWSDARGTAANGTFSGETLEAMVMTRDEL
jgi:hypothetical protein